MSYKPDQPPMYGGPQQPEPAYGGYPPQGPPYDPNQGYYQSNPNMGYYPPQGGPPPQGAYYPPQQGYPPPQEQKSDSGGCLAGCLGGIGMRAGKIRHLVFHRVARSNPDVSLYSGGPWVVETIRRKARKFVSACWTGYTARGIIDIRRLRRS
ncbi:hypothetical protein DL766_009090 [Monosporascus sp. MC13-8B]|uniref:Rhodopsin n=1 Tax=Monosporascus cannonballus TaxID=155416 RepID=A0ABY0GV18_9PEZI|nr:hypothetical protein DL763_010963 [Monosporascus cannonballus]RYO78164.1 hypothetical protein DL762_008840 [Monosporascus cannonballus]RYP16565.1 hypothetical protein DL766_009090 [Monosporascus sp. MC13-8B]